MFRAAILSACAALTTTAQTGPTFGNGLAGVAVCGSKKPPTVILNYSLPAGASHGVLHHFWITGEREKTDRAWIEYTIDGEAAPSIAFQPSFMCGVAFPGLLSHDFEFSAGGLCGKTAPVGGWNNIFPIPFYKTVLVTARADPSDGPGCFGAYLNVRGTVGLPLAVPGSGRPLPFGVRTLLQANALATRQPLEFVVVAELPTGTRGEVFQVSWAVEAQPLGGAAAGGGYIEGCWNFKATAAEPYPGLVAGTGVEDYFDSGYYFGADSGDAAGVLFSNALSGLTQFNRSDPFEWLSAYRFHAADPLVMWDGGMLTWQVGASGHPGATKCGNPLPSLNGALLPPPALFAPRANASRALSAVNVTTYAWLFRYPAPFACDNSTGAPVCAAAASNASGSSWRGGDCCAPPPPAPPGPPPPAPTPSPAPGPPSVVGCASGLCGAFCDNPAVRGCAAAWAADADLRAAPSGAPCGGPLGPCAASPADACAPGWALCLADAAADAGAIARFRANISAAECGAGGGGAFVGAMSHARPGWEGLPPAPCPRAPVSDDNGCPASGWGSEPVCCGARCQVPSCPSSVWAGGTRIVEDEGSGCGAVKPGAVDGVLCCKR